MNESQMTLGTPYHSGIDPAGWPVSEKMDGCRAYWDGSQFWTRGGNVISAPAWFMKGLPGQPLDGEIWAGRERFEEARCAVQYGHFTRRCQFVAFDAPTARGTWRQRMKSAGRLWRDVVEVDICRDRDCLMDRLRRVKTSGGEGLVIRHPEIDCYEIGRTRNMLKVKTMI